MNELDVLNFITSTIKSYMVSVNFDESTFKFPNADIDQENTSSFIEMIYVIYPAVKINLKGSKRVFGCLTFKTITPRGEGLNQSLTYPKPFAELFSGKILNGIVFEEYEVKVLNHTLSETQTTTNVEDNQTNTSIEFSFVR